MPHKDKIKGPIKIQTVGYDGQPIELEMGDRRVNNGTIKKGEVMNPMGITQTEAMRKLVKLGAQELAEIGATLCQGNVDELKRVAEDPRSSVVKVMICRMVVKVLNDGDTVAFNMIMNRIVGKVPDNIRLLQQANHVVTIVDEHKVRDAISKLESEY